MKSMLSLTCWTAMMAGQSANASMQREQANSRFSLSLLNANALSSLPGARRLSGVIPSSVALKSIRTPVLGFILKRSVDRHSIALPYSDVRPRLAESEQARSAFELYAQKKGSEADNKECHRQSIASLQNMIMASPEKAIVQERDYHRYLEYYQLLPVLDIASTELTVLPVHQERIALQTFRPKQQGVAREVVLLHGYQDHVGVHHAVIHGLLRKGYMVRAFDFQGHGLSTGSRCAISSFDRYLDALEAVLNQVSNPKHVQFVAHSTGCSVLINHLLKKGEINPTVMIGPLIRNRSYDQGVKLYRIAEKLALRRGIDVDNAAKPVPDNVVIDSRDHANIEFAKEDPLRGRLLTASWFGALIRWQEALGEMPNNRDAQPLIIQGSEDKVVNFEYNLPILEQKFSRAEVKMWQGVGHQIMSDKPEAVNQLLKEIGDYFDH